MIVSWWEVRGERQGDLGCRGCGGVVKWFCVLGVVVIVDTRSDYSTQF